MSHKDDTQQEELNEKLESLLSNPQVASLLDAFQGTHSPTQGIQSGQTSQREEEAKAELMEGIRAFNLKPREVRDYLDRFVVKQNEAKKVISVAICDHYNHVRRCIEKPALKQKEYSKQNILVLGPTGVGKTYLIRTVAKLIGVPFIKADATKFSETGYVGSDVEDLVRDLVKAANGDTELAQYGIVYIDEIDKIAHQGQSESGRDVSGRGVQINLLKLMEETEVNLFSPTDMMGQMQSMLEMSRSGDTKRPRSINTRHILFIVSGAFGGLSKIVEKRVQRGSIGFGGALEASQHAGTEWTENTRTADYIQYGFEPEFIGRLPVRVACQPLQVDDLEAILTQSEENILNQYKDDFKGYHIDLSITKEAISEIARKAFEEKTGARGLMTVFERVFRNFKFELPSAGVEAFEVSSETIADPNEHLKALLIKNKDRQESALRKDLDRFTDWFQRTHELEISFDEEACKALIEKSLESDKTIRALCEEAFRNFEHGLQIISRNTGQQSFKLTKEHVDKPQDALSKWVTESFQQSQEG